MVQAMQRPLLLVGCGKMGGAMLEGWLETGIAAAGVHIIDPSGNTGFEGRDSVTVHAHQNSLPEDLDPEVILLAVKPQMMDTVLPDYKRFAGDGTVFVSVAAGKTIHYFEDLLGKEAAIIRAMPNTPAAIGQGITVMCPNAHVSAGQIALAQNLLNAIGVTEVIQDEAQMDAVTAVSGSGPAYAFLLIEAMKNAGVAAGLSEELALKLARHTVAGAGSLALQSDETPTQLRINVTSPNGTTQAALDVLMAEQGLPNLMHRAVRAAAERSRELS